MWLQILNTIKIRVPCITTVNKNRVKELHCDLPAVPGSSCAPCWTFTAHALHVDISLSARQGRKENKRWVYLKCRELEMFIITEFNTFHLVEVYGYKNGLREKKFIQK